MSPPTQFTLEHLYKSIDGLLSKSINMFKGLTIANVSINKELIPHPEWPVSYYLGTSAPPSKHTVSLKIPNQVINEYRTSIGGSTPKSASYDITIGSLSVSQRGAITVVVSSIKEEGLSAREILRKRLNTYCEERGYFDRRKKELPRLVTSILALTSPCSEIEDDILSNLNIPVDKISNINCKNSEDISNAIRNADPNHYDIAVLYRGGHEDDAMNMFSSECIIEAVVSSRIPVCVALGHDSDRPFIYEIVDEEFSAPSAFGKGIAKHNHDARSDNKELMISIAQKLKDLKEKLELSVIRDIEQVDSIGEVIHGKVLHKVDVFLKSSESCANRICDKLKHEIDVFQKASESGVARIYDKLLSNIESNAVNVHAISSKIADSKHMEIRHTDLSINQYVQQAYRMKNNMIDDLSKDIGFHYVSINDRQNEKKERRRLYVAFAIILLAVAVGVFLFTL